MELVMSSLTGEVRNKLMHALVVPRPIALVVTKGAEGLNAAPFSFFNVFSGDPAVVALGVGTSKRDGHDQKDTARNIIETGEFVVNMVTESLASAMNVSAVEFPLGSNEVELSDLEVISSISVAPPRVEGSPVSLECRLIETVGLEGGRHIFVAEVIVAHVDDSLILDRERYYIDGNNLGVIARMHGGGWYARTTDMFRMPRLSFEQFQSARSPN